jgi:EAL domain-containing protein (putative c-di-GMP-specific phosphodiesterase class I)
VEVGHSLGLNVIAEGVETREQYDVIRQLGCDIAQGFLISRPVAPGKFAAAVDEWENSQANPDSRSGS